MASVHTTEGRKEARARHPGLPSPAFLPPVATRAILQASGLLPSTGPRRLLGPEAPPRGFTRPEEADAGLRPPLPPAKAPRPQGLPRLVHARGAQALGLRPKQAAQPGP